MSNRGSWIEYTGTAGNALRIWGQSGTDGAGNTMINITVKNLSIEATNASYSGDLVDIRTASQIVFEQVNLSGLPGASPQTHALVTGNQWVDVNFDKVQFWYALNGILQAPLGLSSNWVNIVNIDDSEFKSLATSTDIALSNQTINVNKSTFEPGPSSAASTVRLSGRKHQRHEFVVRR